MGALGIEGELQRTWTKLGIDPAGLRLEPNGTLRAEAHTATRPSDDLLGTLDDVPTDEVELEPLPRLSSEQVEVGDILGEGGTGRVWLAEQRSLKRQVAVKGLRPSVEGPIARMQLLREARVTGRLEHPNVVPVHVLVRDDDGSPRMVMKRIDGRSWSALLAEAREDDEPLTPDQLETHLRILTQVCHAVHYAHARGVLHRDLKPDNVMVGEYGEVYVVDWGIAVALEGAAQDLEELPPAKDVRGIVGTLPYMAPEMVAGDGRELGVHSDVYLLGAILHEILTGTLRHQGQKLPELVHAAWTSAPPEYDEVETPTELAELVKRTTHRDPKERPASADELRLAIEAFLTHRHAATLADEGAVRFMQALSHDIDDDAALRALQEARFAYRQALRIWEESPAANEGLREVLQFWMKRALARRDIGTARVLLTDMRDDQADEWRTKVDAMGRELASRDEKLAKLEAAAEQSDMGMAARKRRGFGVAFAVLFVGVNVALHFVEELGKLNHLGYLGATGALALGFGLPVLAFTRALFPNDASRRLGWSLAFLLAWQVFTFAALWFVGVALRPTIAITLFSLGAMIAVKSAMVDWRMFWSAILTTALGAVALLVPWTTFFAVGVAYGTFFGGGAMLSYEEKLAADAERRANG